MLIEDEPIPLELRIVDEHKLQELQCAICLGLLSHPRQCKNGHLFCETCVLRSIQRSPKCPSCRCPLSENELSRSLFVEKHINTLNLYCKNHFKYQPNQKEWLLDADGCNEVFINEEMKKHEAACPYNWVDCSWNKKCSRVRKKDLEAHLEQCEWRMVACRHCGGQFCARKLEEHFETCSSVDVLCELCGAGFKRMEMESHLLKSCQELLIHCPYGCKEKIIRKNLKQHLQGNIVEHFESMRLLHQRQLQSLEISYQNELRIRDQEIQILKRKSKNETKVIWVIEGWRKTSQQHYVSSKRFEMASCKWFFGLYPDGDVEESKGHLSIFLFVEKQPPKGKLVSVRFSITLVNFKDQNKIIKKELKTSFPLKDNQPGWGDKKLIKTSLITEESGFLLNDELRIESELLIKQITHII
uniref:RING-type domain-containing protein n=1 Tax=Arcella intermedia TaxID=1963864 RepID=A0A6B2L4X5_9EUKA